MGDLVDAEDNHEPSDDGYSEPGQKPGDVVPLPAAGTAPKADKTQCCSSKKERNWIEVWGVIFIGLGFFASAIAAAFSGWQARIASDNEYRGLRPYINVSVGALYNSSPQGSPPMWRAPINIDNNGSTQTERATSELWCSKNDFSVDDPTTTGAVYSGKISRFFGPHQSGSLGACVYPPELLTDAAANRVYLAIAARIIYFDSLTHKDIHVTEFCARLTNIQGDFSQPQGGRMDTESCNSHNCADDECSKKDLDNVVK